MPETFIGPYDDFEKFLRGGNVEESPTVIPVLFGLNNKGRERFNTLSDLLNSGNDENQKVALKEIEQLTQNAEAVLEVFLERSVHRDFEFFIAGLRDKSLHGSDSARSFWGRIVLFVRSEDELDEIEKLLIFTPEDSSIEPIPVFQQLWVGPVVQTAFVKDNFDPAFSRENLRQGSLIDKPVIGIIDDSIGFLNQAFQLNDQSRFDAIWLQKRPIFEEHGLDLGKIITGTEIDNMLREIKRDPRSRAVVEKEKYKELNRENYGVHFFRGTDHDHTHGTHMLGLALGNDTPRLKKRERDVLAVQLPPFALQDMTGHYLSFFAFLGLRWMLKRLVVSDGLKSTSQESIRPLILNVSLGNLAGPKDGSGNFEREFSEEINTYQAATNGRVTAFFSYGNYYENRQVAVAKVEPGKETVLSWQLKADDPTASFLELRSSTDFKVSISHSAFSDHNPPVQTRPADPKPGYYKDIQLNSSKVFGRIYGNVRKEYKYNQTDSPTLETQKDGFVVALRPTSVSGEGQHGYWHIILHGLKSLATVTCQIQSGGTPPSYLGYTEHGRQSQFAALQTDPGVSLTTKGSFSALIPVTDAKHYSVGASRLTLASAANKPTTYASEGGLFPSNQGPTLSAIVEEVQGIDGLSGPGTLSNHVRKTGGSSAAAAIATRNFVQEIRALLGEPLSTYPTFKSTKQPNSRLGHKTLRQ